MSRGPDIGTLLVRTLYRDAAAAGVALTIADSDWVRWASATFCGARHAMTWTALPSTSLDVWLGGLPERDLILRGHLVADITVAGVRRDTNGVMVEIEALTLEE